MPDFILQNAQLKLEQAQHHLVSLFERLDDNHEHAKLGEPDLRQAPPKQHRSAALEVHEQK